MPLTDEHFLEHQEVEKYLAKIFPVIIGESDRGAVLIAASQVDLLLEKALKQIAPQNISKSILKNIFDFSGPLGTFSSKIHMAYYFRVINKELYSAIKNLKALRNDVAHKPVLFSLLDHKDRVANVYQIGPGTSQGIHRWALEELMRQKINQLLTLQDPSKPEVPAFSNANEVIEYISGRQDLSKMFDEQLPRWKLGIGTAVICGLIFHGTECACSVLGNHSTFSSINTEKIKNNKAS